VIREETAIVKLLTMLRLFNIAHSEELMRERRLMLRSGADTKYLTGRAGVITLALKNEQRRC
jgi:hypothetical protein